MVLIDLLIEFSFFFSHRWASQSFGARLASNTQVTNWTSLSSGARDPGGADGAGDANGTDGAFCSTLERKTKEMTGGAEKVKN